MRIGALCLVCIGRNVTDLARAIDFYCKALGFRPVENADHAPLPGVCDTATRSARLQLGAQEIELTVFDPPGEPYPRDSTSADLWFQHCAIVVDDMEAAHARVMRRGATPITRRGPQTLPPSTGSVVAFKFRDPDGHPLELLHFPDGTGDPAWHAMQPQQPMLGIDHSAICVSDVERSVAFYERLGLRVSARSVNRGIEQQWLDDLDDPVVDVIALQPADSRTPHVELLGYRQPRGRALQGMSIRDTAADRLVLRVLDLHQTASRLSGIGAQFGLGASPDDRHAAVLRDPDGHWLVLV